MCPKVFFLTDLWLPRIGGLERSIEYLANELSGRIELCLLVPGEPHPEDARAGAPVVRVPLHDGRPWYSDAIRLIEKRCGDGPIIAHFFGFSFRWPVAQARAIRELREKYGASLVLKVPTLGDPTRSLPTTHAGLQNVVNAWISLTPAIADELAGLGVAPRRIVRLPNGIPLERFQPATAVEKQRARRDLGLPQDPLVVGFAGRFVRRKRIDIVIEALSRIPAERRPTLALIGEPDPAYEDPFDPSPYLDEHVRWIRKQKDMWRVYPALDAYITTSEVEGMSNAVLESLSMGLPVLATDIPGHAELVRHGWNGWLYPAGDIERLNASFAELSSVWARGNLPRMGERSRTLAEEKYDVCELADHYVTLYRRLPAGAYPLPDRPRSSLARSRIDGDGRALVGRDDELGGQTI